MRLLFWNIQRFSINKMNPSSPANGGPPPMDEVVQTTWRACHINGVIAKVQPDIIAIVEAQSDRGFLGTLQEGNGKTALLELLASLRILNRAWCLVPPLKMVGSVTVTGYTEVVAVFFRSDTIDFVGPYVWPQAAPAIGPKVPVPATGAMGGDYPPEWQQALPANNRFAGQFRFFDATTNSEIKFVDDSGRRPFHTVFVEKNQPTNRTFRIVFSHPTPNPDAKVCLARLTALAELDASKQTPNEVHVLAGDFNIDIRANLKPVVATYLKFIATEFTFLFPPTAGSTLYQNTTMATTTSYRRNEALDNILVRYHKTATPPAHNADIVDRVAATPPFISGDMMRSLSSLQNDPRFADDNARQAAFREFVNFGHIGPTDGVSDHLAIYADL